MERAVLIKNEICGIHPALLFCGKAFVDVAKKLDMSKYELAIRETKTMEVIQEVSTMKSEIGVLYLSEFNLEIYGKTV